MDWIGLVLKMGIHRDCACIKHIAVPCVRSSHARQQHQIAV